MELRLKRHGIAVQDRVVFDKGEEGTGLAFDAPAVLPVTLVNGAREAA